MLLTVATVILLNLNLHSPDSDTLLYQVWVRNSSSFMKLFEFK
jgi:hypothetical protein